MIFRLLFHSTVQLNRNAFSKLNFSGNEAHCGNSEEPAVAKAMAWQAIGRRSGK